MSEDRDWGRAIERLEELTRAGSLAWTPRSLSRDDIVGDAHVAAYDDKLIAVYEYRRKQDPLGVIRPVKDVAIEFISDDGNIQWTWPQSPHRWALLNAIRYQLSRADQFYDRLLAE